MFRGPLEPKICCGALLCSTEQKKVVQSLKSLHGDGKSRGRKNCCDTQHLVKYGMTFFFSNDEVLLSGHVRRVQKNKNKKNTRTNKKGIQLLENV
jgi:hypothetical protein